MDFSLIIKTPLFQFSKNQKVKTKEILLFLPQKNISVKKNVKFYKNQDLYNNILIDAIKKDNMIYYLI